MKLFTFNRLVGRAISALALSVAAFSSQAAVSSGYYNNQNDLDFSGSFKYAVTMNPFAVDAIVGDAKFSYFGSTAGLSVSNSYQYDQWVGPLNTPFDEVVSGIIWSVGNGAPDVVSLTMSGLNVGSTYKMQLLFGEACCNRAFDVYQDGQLLVNDHPTVSNGFGQNRSYVMNTFTAMSSRVTVSLGGFINDSIYSDPNPILNAATLEQLTAPVPEPESYAMFAMGLGALGAISRRRRSRN